eukprot:CCRYP_000055-RC/>CCRYP_000055-RC protein AED:0.08 eAED:0.07 QI:0/0.87/0.88/1/1/1/9/176/1325
MDDANEQIGGKALRRSTRVSKITTTTTTTTTNGRTSGGEAARVTPSPTECDSGSASGEETKKKEEEKETKNTKKRKSGGVTKEKNSSPYFSKRGATLKAVAISKRLELAECDVDEEEELDSDTPLASASKRVKTGAKSRRVGGGGATSETVPTKKAAAKKGNGGARSAAQVESSSAKKKRNEAAKKKGNEADKKNHKKRTNKKLNNDDDDDDSIVSAGKPDGNGGLNQPSPFNVEYSKSSRATCRTCDEVIRKGDVRVGHTPLFRGKPGYMVFRHLHCVVFSEDVTCAEDVINYETLEDADYQRLVEQVEASKYKIKEEKEELEPDELVQKSFEGEIRSEPPGLTATLLPFQIEGFSWMRHQEVKSDIRGGILADEMGMGKTIQTIATILDNRPKLQHCKPNMKHPFSDDLKQRQEEDLLWEKGRKDLHFEWDILKVMKKIRSRDGGGRGGTLVVCPVIALTQWKTEIEKFTDGSLTICTYHGPNRESETPREMLKKYDVVLTTYQVVEADFRKMTSPNRVTCPNCGGKFKIDKLPIHLKYFCGETAQKTEAQARQQRNSDRDGSSRRRGRRPDRPFGKTPGKKDKKDDAVVLKKFKSETTASKKEASTKANTQKKASAKKKETAAAAAAKKLPAARKKTASKKSAEKTDADVGRPGSKRSAARKAATKITKTAAEWMPPDDDSGSDVFQSKESSSDEESELENSSAESDGSSSDSDSDNSALQRARIKQQEALERARNSKGKKKSLPAKKDAKKSFAKNGKKKFDDDSSSSSDESDDEGGAGNDLDMDALVVEAMEGAKNSVLHSLCWWRVILDEAHFIKTRSSQTANAAFSLVGIYRWCLSGTPLQNRVGEFYSLVRFLRLDPMAYYYCRAKGCECKNMHYRIVAGVCEDCGHGGVQHYSHFNKYVLNPIQREGYTGDGRRAMFTLKNEVLDKCLLRRTKETKAADMELPPRIVQIKPIRLHPVEEDFYSALYTQTKSSFNDYVDSGTLLNNYAHIFDLLIRMRQSVDHPYLVIYSNKNTNNGQSTPTGDPLMIANGSADCDLCHEPPTDRVVSTCCGAAYCRACVLEYMSGTTGLAASDSLRCPSCRGAFSIDLEARVDLEDDSALNAGATLKKQGGSEFCMPSLKELPHVATGSILRRINLADFATSSKIEALTEELVQMRQKSPGSKAIVFSQFVNMLDLIRWRLHSDPYLEDIGLGARALHGGMNVKARDACLKEFREDHNVRVLLMSLKAGGVALNLTCANYIFLMDPWWNPAQAIDRTHRLGQYRPIRAVRFIAENTVEERILQLQEKKRLVFDGTVGRDAGSLKMLTVEDMKSLFA